MMSIFSICRTDTDMSIHRYIHMCMVPLCASVCTKSCGPQNVGMRTFFCSWKNPIQEKCPFQVQRCMTGLKEALGSIISGDKFLPFDGLLGPGVVQVWVELTS